MKASSSLITIEITLIIVRQAGLQMLKKAVTVRVAVGISLIYPSDCNEQNSYNLISFTLVVVIQSGPQP